MALEQEGLKQKDLARRLGWAESRVSKILGGEQTMTVDDLIQMTRALNLDIALLFKPPPHPDMASPLSLDLGQAATPRYVTLPLEWDDRPSDNRPPNYQAA
jgi:transcriptional regulator with XRE-family HTH domain